MIGTHGYRRLVKANTLAELLDVSVRTIRAWQKDGRIPYVRVSPGTVRFDVDQVMAALQEREVGTRRNRSTK